MRKSVFLAAAILLASSVYAEDAKTSTKTVEQAQSLMGAKAVLAKFDETFKTCVKEYMERKKSKSSESPLSKIFAPRVDRGIEFLKSFDVYKTTQSSMSDEEAASKWLELFDRFCVLKAYNQIYRSDFSIETLAGACLNPSSWKIIQRHLDQKLKEDKTPSDYLCKAAAIFHALNMDIPALREDIKRGRTIAKSKKRMNVEMSLENCLALEYYVKAVENYDKPYSVQLDSFLVDLAFLEKTPPTSVRLIRIPDLYNLAGKKEAAQIIRRLLNIPNVAIDAPEGAEQTEKLAVSLALEFIDKLKTPQWALCDNFYSGQLYKAMSSRFTGDVPDAFMECKERNWQSYISIQPKKEESEESLMYRRLSSTDSGTKLDADLTQVFCDLTRNNIDASVSRYAAVLKHWKKYKPDLYQNILGGLKPESFLQYVPADCFYSFYIKTYELDPENFKWNALFKAAVRAGREENMLEFLDKILQTLPKDSSLAKAELTLCKGKLYAAMDKPEKAAALYMDVLSMLKYYKKNDPKHYDSTIYEFNNKLHLCIDDAESALICLGNVLSVPAYKNAAFKSKLDWCLIMKAVFGDDLEGSLDDYFQNKDYAGAESFIVDSAQKFMKMRYLPSPEDEYSIGAEMYLDKYIAAIAEIYYNAGRNEELIYLLTQSPWYTKNSGWDTKTALMLTKALHASGQKDKALVEIKHLLFKTRNDDELYEFFLEIAPADTVIPFLDKLYSYDAFEERPLIWKAEFLRRQGKFAEAENVIKQALKVDPTDGGQDAGQRVKAYAVFAEILTSLGKDKDAESFRNVVKSVRIAEEGDSLHSAGLYKRSLAKYEEAQKFFADAYCVQWRLGKRLMELGQRAEAEKHFDIAFERMPEQFGQVASFCFRCEGVFEDNQSMSSGEKVLSRLVSEGSKRPQVYYLLGQLREKQGRYADAYDSYKKALELDPLYMDVLKQMRNISSRFPLSCSEQDALRVKNMQLDPYGERGGTEVNDTLSVCRFIFLLNKIDENRERIQAEYPETIKPMAGSIDIAAYYQLKKHDVDRGFNNIRRSHLLMECFANRLLFLSGRINFN